MNFLFDVDGTLTPPRKPMIPEFRDYFSRWLSIRQDKQDKVFLVTGSDKNKTLEQIGKRLWIDVDGSYQCSGNQLYVKGSLIKSSSWKMSDRLRSDILEEIKRSQWFGRSSINIEERVGMINISTVGRNSGSILRKEYLEWDSRNLEREKIVRSLSDKHSDLSFCIGGEISIDIYPKGMDKSQAINDMDGACMFFGDKCEKGGNDHSIAINCSEYHNVSGWEETMDVLKIYED